MRPIVAGDIDESVRYVVPEARADTKRNLRQVATSVVAAESMTCRRR
jgi:hypothetical protein